MKVELLLQHIGRRYLLALSISVMMWITNHAFGWAAEVVSWFFR